jgi:hypothetical protein
MNCLSFRVDDVDGARLAGRPTKVTECVERSTDSMTTVRRDLVGNGAARTIRPSRKTRWLPVVASITPTVLPLALLLELGREPLVVGRHDLIRRP